MNEARDRICKCHSSNFTLYSNRNSGGPDRRGTPWHNSIIQRVIGVIKEGYLPGEGAGGSINWRSRIQNPQGEEMDRVLGQPKAPFPAGEGRGGNPQFIPLNPPPPSLLSTLRQETASIFNRFPSLRAYGLRVRGFRG